jgi:hypothetical protein
LAFALRTKLGIIGLLINRLDLDGFISGVALVWLAVFTTLICSVREERTDLAEAVLYALQVDWVLLQFASLFVDLGCERVFQVRGVLDLRYSLLLETLLCWLLETLLWSLISAKET